MELNCIIIDDDQQTVETLKSYMADTPCVKLTGSCSNAVEAIRLLQQNDIQLAFINLRLQEMSGVEFSSMLPRNSIKIFMTDDRSLGIEGYKADAVDCLLKPISKTAFIEDMHKVHEICEREEEIHELKKDRFLFVKSDYKVLRLDFDNIIYIEGVKDYVKFHLDNEETPILSLMNMKKLEHQMTGDEFLRVHRSYIVNMRKVRRIERMKLIFSKGSIPISESYKDEVFRFVDHHSIV